MVPVLVVGGTSFVTLSPPDRILLQRCLDRAPHAWQHFVDRFLGLVVHVANHTAESRGLSLDQSTRDDLAAEVFLVFVANDLAVLRRFQRNCSLATYLTVISRRVIVRRLNTTNQLPSTSHQGDETQSGVEDPAPTRIDDREEIQRLMQKLDSQEANVVRMYHLEGKSYEEISRLVGLSENSIGPLLSRARDKMRDGA